ncbi:hypothetical protein FGD71_000365 [Streptomyces sporangiiformans]|uniref:Uncharacterized protein n=1 Tax=Streptomyces sporangiiformans TaxID=2315329 RepID=A0A505DSG9_9ACTN|nr:hypothetical protein FGD71_000365 [Streptomyces sporangiiformans]
MLLLPLRTLALLASPPEQQELVGLAVEPDGAGAAVALRGVLPDVVGGRDELLADVDGAGGHVGLSYAAQTLGALPATTVYLDGGNATWIRPTEMASRLKDAGIAFVRGVAVNVANFDAIDVCCTYATQITSTGATQPAVGSASPARSGSAAPTICCGSRYPVTLTVPAASATDFRPGPSPLTWPRG